MPVINANSVDFDQTPPSAVSDLDLQCLLMSHLWGATHKWINTKNIIAYNTFCFVHRHDRFCKYAVLFCHLLSFLLVSPPPDVCKIFRSCVNAIKMHEVK